MGKFKIWEILLFVAVILLGAIAYESHKANSSSRYVMVNNNPWELLDTHTGNFWSYKYPKLELTGGDTTYVYKWTLFTPGPGQTVKADTSWGVNK